MTRFVLPGQPLGHPGYPERPGTRSDYLDSEWLHDGLHGAMLQHVVDHGVYTLAEQLKSSDLAGRSDEDLATQLIGGLLDPVALGSGPERHELVAGETLYDDGQPIHSKILQLTWRVDGPAEWLTHWPWKARNQPRDPSEIEAATNRLAEGGCELTPSYAVGAGEIHSCVNVFDDEDPVAEARDRRIAERHEYVLEYLGAHADAVAVCAAKIHEYMTAVVSDRRRDLRFTDAVLDGLDLPFAHTPRLEFDDPTLDEQTATAANFELPPPTLNDASFENIVKVIDGWKSTIQKGARFLHGLPENGLTFTLLPVLEAAFGVAEHGVFVHNGATDITIPAGRLAAMLQRELPVGNDDIFVAEAKKGSGETLAQDAKDQLDLYLSRRTRRACLIFFITNDAFTEAFGRVMAGLLSHPEYDGPAGSIGTIPVLRFNDRLARLQRSVAVVGVSLPQVTNQKEERSRRRSAS